MIDRIGEINTNNKGYIMTIINCNNNNVDVEFDSGYIAKNIQYINFLKGTVKDKFEPSFLGVGYTGDGEFVTKIKGKHTYIYNKWRAMLTRCYGKNQRKTYDDCYVCDKWLNFQNFAQWLNDNLYEIDGEQMELDKDIKIKNNKVYSPETCLLIPKRINDVILNRTFDRSSICLGVHKHGDKFVTACSRIDGSNGYIGTFNTKEEAFNAYKSTKESEIKKIEDLYKDKIPKHIYEAIIAYKVEITD